jgi:superfamily II DNA helicase RecQ
VVVAAIRRGKKAKGPLKPPEPAASDPRITERYAALHSWRKQRAIRRGVESDVIISKQILWNLAERAPRSVDDLHNIDGIGPWRLQTYGQEIIDVLNRY